MAAADQSGPSPQRAGVALLLALAVAAAVGGLSGWRPAASAATAGGVPAPAHARASAASKSPHTPPPPSWDASLVYTPTGQHHLAGDLLNLPHDGLAPATRAVQRWLYEWQYAPPGGCAAARFAVGNLDLPLGMGAQLHLASAMLAMAIGQGRIFLWGNATMTHLGDPATCAGRPRNIECFTRPASACTLAHARAPGANTTEWDDYAVFPHGEADPRLWNKDYVPAPIKALYRAGAGVYTTDELTYWWRSQAVGFLMRLNRPTVDALRSLRLAAVGGGGALRHAGPPGNGNPGADAATLAAQAWRGYAQFPLPRGVTGLHIRHGDKVVEVPGLLPAEAYYAAAERWVRRVNPGGFVRAGFVSTDDPGVAANLSALAEGSGGGSDTLPSPLPPPTEPGGAGPGWWTWMWWDDTPRTANISLNPGWMPPPEGMPMGQLSLRILLNVLTHLECDAWVGTRLWSSWARLIDELRCVWVPKCRNVYVDLPVDPDVTGYDWRRRRRRQRRLLRQLPSQAGPSP